MIDELGTSIIDERQQLRWFMQGSKESTGDAQTLELVDDLMVIFRKV